MSKARDISNLFSAATAAATDAEVTSAIASHASNTTNRHYKVGTTANRPESPNVGDLYFDTDLDRFIEYRAAGWKQISEVPDAPTSVSATETGNTTASISFTAPTNVPVASYLVTSSPGNVTASGSSSPISITGLTAGTSYTFSIIAQGYNGNSQSATSNSITTPSTILVDYLVVAGGGGGGSCGNSDNGPGGGGAGGFRTSAGTSGGGASAESQIELSPGNSYTVTIGAGGAGGITTDPNRPGIKGSNSSFHTIVSIGGGGSISGDFTVSSATGGSGAGSYGGNAGVSSGDNSTAGQGYRGGYKDATNNVGSGGGGGGGAGAVGATPASASRVGGAGGNGVSSSISGSSITYAGGGGGGGINGGGAGGLGGGAAGQTGNNASVNTGGGGGGRFNGTAGSGGSGIIILRSPQQASSTTGSPAYTTSGENHIYQFTASGSITF